MPEFQPDRILILSEGVNNYVPLAIGLLSLGIGLDQLGVLPLSGGHNLFLGVCLLLVGLPFSVVGWRRLGARPPAFEAGPEGIRLGRNEHGQRPELPWQHIRELDSQLLFLNTRSMSRDMWQALRFRIPRLESRRRQRGWVLGWRLSGLGGGGWEDFHRATRRGWDTDLEVSVLRFALHDPDPAFYSALRPLAWTDGGWLVVPVVTTEDEVQLVGRMRVMRQARLDQLRAEGLAQPEPPKELPAFGGTRAGEHGPWGIQEAPSPLDEPEPASQEPGWGMRGAGDQGDWGGGSSD